MKLLHSSGGQVVTKTFVAPPLYLTHRILFSSAVNIEVFQNILLLRKDKNMLVCHIGSPQAYISH